MRRAAALAAALVLLAPAAGRAATIRIVAPGDTATFDGAKTDTDVRVGDTFTLEVWVNATDTFVNGFQVHLDYDQTVLALLESSDPTDSFPPASAGTNSNELRPPWGDVLANQGNGDTILYAALTDGDSTRIDTHAVRFTFQALAATYPNTTVIGFRFSPETTAVTAADSGATPVLTAVDSGVVLVRVAQETHVVISAVSPRTPEWFAIYNPTDVAVDLSTYYVSDDTAGYWNAVNGGDFLGATDFAARFPAGTTLGVGETIVVAVSSASFHSVFPGVRVDFELDQDGTADGVPDMVNVDIGSTKSLTDGGEALVLFRWDGVSDLVGDVDIVVWGTDRAPNKTGVSIDGPDPGAETSTYAADSATMTVPLAPAAGEVLRRVDLLAEPGERKSGGNGIVGHDETSESVATSFGNTTDTVPWHRMLVAHKRGNYVGVVATAGETEVEALSFRLRGARGQADTVTEVNVVSLGVADTANIDTVSLWIDANSDSTIGAGDTKVGDLAATGPRAWRFTGSLALPATTGRDMILGFAVRATVEDGETVQFRIPSFGILAAISDSASFLDLTNAAAETLFQAVLKVAKAVEANTATVRPGDVNVTVLSLRITGHAAGDTLTNIALANAGNLDETDVTVRMWRDDGDNVWSAGDSLVGSMVFDTGARLWRLDGRAETLAGGGTVFVFTIDVAAAAAREFDTFQARIPANAADAAAAETGPAQAVANAYVQTLALPAGIASHVVIAAAYIDDLGVDGDGEWVLLYNPTDAPVNVQSWTIRRTGAASVALPDSTLPRHGFLLVADATFNANKDNPAWPSADVGVSLTLNNTNDGIALFDSGGFAVDKFGWGTEPDDKEGTTAANVVGNRGDVYVRKAHALSTKTDILAGGRDEAGGAAYDSFDNATDFILVPGSETGLWTLRNSASTPETPGRQTTVVKIFQNVADDTALNGETNVTAAAFYVQGETLASGTLQVFRVEATDPIADTNLAAVRLWRDADGNGVWSAADTLVATLVAVPGTDAWETTVASISFDALAGETLVVTIDAADTVDDGETFRARVAVRTVRASGTDSGPTAVRTNAGTILLRQLNPVVVVKGPNVPSETVVPTADTLTVIAVRVRGALGGDTLTRFAIENLGSIDSADVANVRLWRDANGDSTWSAGDTLVSTLVAVSARRWEDTTLSLFLGGGADLVVTIDLGSAGDGETFQARIPANGLEAVASDPGPLAAVDEVGRKTVSAAAAVRALLQEVSVAGTNDFVEVLVLDDGNGGGGANLRGWSVWDWPVGSGTDRKVIGDTNYDGVADVDVIVRTGERIVIFDAAGVDETSAGADSVVEAYGESMTLTSTEDEVVLYDPTSTPRDAVVWANRDGTPAAGWEADFAGVISIGMWHPGTPAFGDTTHNNAVTPRQGTAFATGFSIQRGGTVDNDSYLDWGEASITQGAPNAMESPPVAPPRITSVSVADVPNDLGGALRVSWTPNTGVPDFLEYRVYLETVPLATLLDTNILPRATVTDSSVGTVTITGLANGASYRAVVTMADSYGLEFRFGLTDTGPAVPTVNITETPAILVTEVFAQATGGSDTDYIECYVADDGNPSGGIDLTGWRIEWQSGGSKTLSGVTAAAGEYLVLGFNQPSNTDDADSGGDGVVTLRSTSTGIVSTDAYVRVLDPNNRLVSFVFFSNRDGTLAAAVQTAVRQAIDSGVWTGDTVENAGVTPAAGSAWAANEIVALAFVDSRVVAGRDSWSVTTTRSKGTANVGIESPATVPVPPTVTLLRDLPNDLGGALEVRWTPDTTLADFARYAIYLDKRPIAPRLDTSSLRPRTTVADSSVGAAVLTGLTDGESYWVAVTTVDTWGHERRNPVVDTGPVAPVRNVTGPVRLLFSEVKFSGTGTEFIEIRVIDDGNPTGNLNLAGFKVAQDDTVAGDVLVFGDVTVGDSDFVVLWNIAGTSETDSGGDGVVEIFNLTFSMPEGDEGLFLIEAGGDTILDFVFWSTRDGTITASEVPHLDYAISRGAWANLGATQNNARNPLLFADFDDNASITRARGFIDTNSDTDWAVDSPPTPGALPNILEAPFAAPAAVAGVDASDVPNDLGGAIRLVWNASPETDLRHYNLYRATTPIPASLYATDTGPVDTAPASDTSRVFTGLVNGVTYWFAVTAVDTFGNERKTGLLVDSAVPVANVVGETLLITEVSFAEGAAGVHGHDWVEVRCETDGTGGRGIDLAGWRLVSTADADKTFGTLLLFPGEFLVIHYAAGTDEADTRAGNGDSIVDVYVGAGAGLTGTDNALTLFRSTGDTEDFVAWTSPAGAPVNAAESAAIANAFAAGQWTDVAPSGVGVEDGVNSDSVAANQSIARSATTNDTNHKDDWMIDASPTPGETHGAVTRWRVFGTVDMESRAVDSDVIVTIGNGSETYVARSDAAGSFVVRARDGTYDLTADTSNFLRRRVGVTVAGASQAVNPPTLLAGDANNDGRIDILDAAITKYAIDAGTGNPAADHVDPVGTVNAADLGAVRANFERRDE